MSLEPSLWEALASTYFYRQSAHEGRRWLLDHPEISGHVPTSAASGLDDVIDEVLGHLADGTVLFARRREFVDLIVAAGNPILMGGSPFYRTALSRVNDELGDALAESLGRRARFALSLQRRSTPAAPDLILSDQGPGRY